MPNIKRVFISGRMNKDLDERLLPDGIYSDALNVDVGYTDGDNSGVVKNISGNTKIGDLANVSGRTVDENTYTIGYTVYEADNTIYWLVASDYFDGIYEYSKITGNITRVLQSNKATPSTVSKLNFSKDYRVTGINYENGFLFWTNDLNPPRRVNVARAKSYNIDDSRIDLDIDVILPPPLNPPIIDMLQETGQENNLQEKFTRFATRYKYIDNQFSAMSPFSGLAFVPDDYFLDYGAGENKSMLNTKNKVRISFDTGNQFVVAIELLVIDTKSLNVSVVETFDKEKLGIPDNYVHSFDFANNKIYRVLPSAQLGRMFDNVPSKAKAQEVIGRRLVYGNYEQFFDIVDSNGNEIKIDFTVGFKNRWWLGAGTPVQTFRSNRSYEVAVQYGDDPGRFTTPLTSENNTVYIPPEFSVTANSLIVEINNKPPAFASWYRLMIKQARKAYYSIFPILYYADGMYRYFLVNSFDRDKVKEGEYVIFKGDNEGPTQDDNKYKILEFKDKDANFLSLNNSNEIAGLYFKIKVEDSSEFNPGAITTFTKNNHGGNAPNSAGSAQVQGGTDSLIPAAVPIKNRYKIAETPIHYGDGNPDVVSVISGTLASPNYYLLRDLRFTVEILSQTEFRYTSDVSESSGWVTEQIVTTSNIPLYYNGFLATYITITQQLYYTIGDKWKINCRGDGHLNGNTFNGLGLPRENMLLSLGSWGGGAVLPGNGWNDIDLSGAAVDKEIKSGAVVRIEIIEDRYNVTQQAGVQQFAPSPRTYRNIEEWFYESGAVNQFVFYDQNGTNVGAKAVSFRRGWFFSNNGLSTSCDSGIQVESGYAYDTSGTIPFNHEFPVQMIIQGYGIADNDPYNTFGACVRNNFINAWIDIQQTENLSICETVAQESDIDIYHEVSRTYPIENGYHKVTWSYLDFTFPSWVNIDGTQYTNLGQLIPGSEDTDGIAPHYFQVGDRIDVRTTGGAYNITYTVLAVPDKYNIVINQVSLGSGPVTPGTVGFSHDQYIESDQTALMPARILLNATNKYNIYEVNGDLSASLVAVPTPGNTNSMYNAYTFGNGLESDRIRDDFNSTTIEYSPRVSTPIENYRKERKPSSLTYSGIFNSNSSINAFNEFNLSTANFKDLSIEFGSIQKLFSRDTNLDVFQENKVSYVLYGKNVLNDSTGGGQVVSVQDVLGTQVPYPEEWGISSNPESFAFWGGKIWFTDARRGSVLMMTGSGEGAKIMEISEIGMFDFFKDLLSDIPNTEKIGGYDPRRSQYVISSNEQSSIACQLSLTSSGKDYPYSNGTILIENNKPDFSVISNTSWTVSIEYSSGSGWVTGYPASGFGNQSVYLDVANNSSYTIRTATITFTYCGGLTETFVVTQGGRKGKVIIWVIPPTAPAQVE